MHVHVFAMQGPVLAPASSASSARTRGKGIASFIQSPLRSLALGADSMTNRAEMQP